MAYIVIDIFSDKNAAEIRAEAYRKAGRQNVKVLEVNGITMNDCTVDPCVAMCGKDGSPLYVIRTEG